VAVDKVGVDDNDVDVEHRIADAELGSESDHEPFSGCMGGYVGWAVPLRYIANDTPYIGKSIEIELRRPTTKLTIFPRLHAFVHGQNDRDSQDVNLHQVNGRMLLINFKTHSAEKSKLRTIPKMRVAPILIRANSERTHVRYRAIFLIAVFHNPGRALGGRTEVEDFTLESRGPIAELHPHILNHS
jgi:hypothetical protein